MVYSLVHCCVYKYIKILFERIEMCIPSPDPPDPPTRLKIQNVRKGSVNLTWKAPKNDGGSPVTHYSVDLLCWDASGTQKEHWRR